MSIVKQDLEKILNSLSQEDIARLKGSTLLITGCAGFLGFYFMHFFNEYGKQLQIEKVIALDNYALGKPDWITRLEQNPIFIIKQFDIVSDDINSIAGAEQANLIIHMASIASPPFYRKYPIETLDANIWGLRQLLDFYINRNIRGFLFFSSSEIYGDPAVDSIPTDEEYRGFVSCTGPRACYDESKRFGETMCMLFAQKYNMPIGVVRPFNNYGPGMELNDLRAPADFAKAVMSNKDIVVLSDGLPTRTFCYISDDIVGYMKVLLHGKYDYFNIGIDTPEITIYRLAEIYRDTANRLFGYEGRIVFETSPDKDYLTHSPNRRCPNIDKARKVLGYAPSILVEEGVERYLKYLKENEKGSEQ